MDAEFEQKMAQQPVRKIPTEWRADILSAAHDAKSVRHSSFVIRHSWIAALNRQLTRLLWPHPAAWAGLAAVWIFIFAVNFSIRDRTPVVAKTSSPPSPEMVAQLHRQQKLYAELLGTVPASDADRPKDAPRPRTQCIGIWTA